ncbi:rhodanese-like domain-containing protein [Labilibaculum euxinus]
MDMFLLIVSIVAIVFGIYWYFIHTPDYTGYISVDGGELKKYSIAEELFALTQSPVDDIWIVDTREEEYFLLGHIPTALNYPFDEIENRYSEMPLGTKLIFYCDLTLKSQNVINFLEEKGHTQMLNWGKYKYWTYPEIVEEDIFV